MRPNLPIAVRVVPATDGIAIRVSRGKRDDRFVEITPHLLLSFGGEAHRADAYDLVRAVVAEINRALVDIQTAPKSAEAGE